MYHSKILIHLIWRCDNDIHMLNHKQDKVRGYLLSLANKNKINLQSLAVLSNHIHCIVELNSVQSVSDIIQTLKGASSLWINNNLGLTYKFKWEDGYYAFSFGYSQYTEFEKYIKNQKDLHEEISFKTELSHLANKYQLNLT